MAPSCSLIEWATRKGANTAKRPMSHWLLCAMSLALLTEGTTARASGIYINVLNPPYNATGDGVTNDRVAIQSAIDAASSAGGGIVELPGGHTFLSGDLQLGSGVTLNIDATLKQSLNPTDYAHQPSFGRLRNSGIEFDSWSESNYPLIFSGQTSNVSVTGSGTVRMSYTGDDATSIVEHAIGFSQVSNFSVSGITVTGAMAYNITLRNCDHGEIHNVTTTNPATINSDGVSIMDSTFIDVHDNNLATLDDGIYVWASYQDPRKSEWWDSDTPRTSHDINVYNNVVNNMSTNGSHGFAFIDWTAAAPDESQVEVSRINVHDNTLMATYPVAALVGDPYHGQNEKTPTKDLTFRDNVLTVVAGGAKSQGLNEMATTDFSGDDPAYNVGLASDSTGLYNSDFDAHNAFSAELGTSFWSTEGDAGVSNANVGQPGGFFGNIQGFENGYSGIYQGVYLQPGRYTFTAFVQSSGANIRLFAIQASTLAALPGSILFNNTNWQVQSITFDITVADTYRLGIDDRWVFGSAGSFGRIDSTSLSKIQ